MKAVVLFSGGIGSWAAAHRAIGQGYDVELLFTDTKIEDEDLYRFLDDAEADLGVPLHRIADGRTVWEVFHEEGMIGNTRADICSRILKRDLARDWIDERWPDGVTVVMGIDWSEIHRYDRAKPRWEPHALIAPLTEPPLLAKDELQQWASDRGIKPPRLYDMGFPHNNCGGFCVKQGQAAFVNLLKTMPERYAEHEAEEEKFRETTGKDVSIMRDRRGGETTPLTMRQLREDYEARPEQLVLDDWGGCGCMVD